MSAANHNHSFSADVQMQLNLNGHILSIGQLGPDFIMLDDPVDHPPADAEIRIAIDGREKRWRVHLIDGIAAGTRKTRTAAPRTAVDSR
jgi:hypothetical protein